MLEPSYIESKRLAPSAQRHEVAFAPAPAPTRRAPSPASNDAAVVAQSARRPSLVTTLSSARSPPGEACSGASRRRSATAASARARRAPSAAGGAPHVRFALNHLPCPKHGSLNSVWKSTLQKRRPRQMRSTTAALWLLLQGPALKGTLPSQAPAALP